MECERDCLGTEAISRKEVMSPEFVRHRASVSEAIEFATGRINLRLSVEGTVRFT